MIGPRILTVQDQQLGVVDIVQGNAGLTDPDGLGQRVAGRLVAHVGAVRQIVGAVCPYKQLIQKRRLIWGGSGGEKDASAGCPNPLSWPAISRFAASHSMGS